MLKALACKMPRIMMSIVSSKFSELERQLRVKAANIEEVDNQRRFAEELPGKLAPLVAEVEATKVSYHWEGGVA